VRRVFELNVGEIVFMITLLDETSGAAGSKNTSVRNARSTCGSKHPRYQLFYDGEEPPKLPNLPKRKTEENLLLGSSGKEAWLLTIFRLLFSRMEESNRRLLLHVAQKMARTKGA
jgi:hypothetical protein